MATYVVINEATCEYCLVNNVAEIRTEDLEPGERAVQYDKTQLCPRDERADDYIDLSGYRYSYAMENRIFEDSLDQYSEDSDQVDAFEECDKDAKEIEARRDQQLKEDFAYWERLLKWKKGHTARILREAHITSNGLNALMDAWHGILEEASRPPRWERIEMLNKELTGDPEDFDDAE